MKKNCCCSNSKIFFVRVLRFLKVFDKWRSVITAAVGEKLLTKSCREGEIAEVDKARLVNKLRPTCNPISKSNMYSGIHRKF